jgi:acyl-CoA thioester hydrolase
MEQPRSAIKNITSYRVIYGDTDQMGVVYYANYLRWFERGRSEFLRQMGCPYGQIESKGYHFPVTELSCRYFKPVYYDDLITIETQLTALRRATLNFRYKIFRQGEGEPLAMGTSTHACLAAGGRIARIPPDLANLLASGLHVDQDRPEGWRSARRG